MIIPASLLFQNERISWISEDIFWPLIGALCTSLVVYGILHILTRIWRKKPSPNHDQYPILQESDLFRNDFETYALNILKQKLEFHHLPKATSTHTRKDIRSYITDHAIIEVFSKLESAEYQ